MVFKKLSSPYETKDVEAGVVEERETVRFVFFLNPSLLVGDQAIRRGNN
jgi:hypothetical protein